MMTGLAERTTRSCKRAQLVLTMAELQRQMHEEDADIVEFELDDQSLDAGVEVVKTLAGHARRGQQRIGLLAHDRAPAG